MADISKMKRPDIMKWILKFDKIISDKETDEKTRELCKKWKADAVSELENRDFRKEQYLKRNGIRK